MHLHSTQLPLPLETEEWRPVVRYEGWYEVSSLGRVRRIKDVDDQSEPKGTHRCISPVHVTPPFRPQTASSARSLVYKERRQWVLTSLDHQDS